MFESHLSTPIAFFIFNRPHLTQKVFEVIRDAKPATLLVIADGSRSDRIGEAELCAETRAIIKQVDWHCEVLTNFSETNLGCKRRVSSGLDWVFETVEEAIILEDDCLPHATFFPFCEELLERYRHDERIMMISADNFQLGQKRTGYSYYFSRYINIWGWATWRRAWKRYDLEMRLWEEVRDGNWLIDILSNPHTVSYWQERFQTVFDHSIDTWDYQWVFACWIQGGRSVVPNVNLVSNIGFGANATHTHTATSKASCLPIESIAFPLKHPPFLIEDTLADRFIQKYFLESSDSYGVSKMLRRLYRKLFSIN